MNSIIYYLTLLIGLSPIGTFVPPPYGVRFMRLIRSV